MNVRRPWRIAGVVALGWWLGTVRFAAGADAPPPASEGKDDPSNLVVVITGKLGGVDRVGGGIVVGEGPDRLYIATANHNVRQGGQTVGDLAVRFKALPGETFEAKLLGDFDNALDLAVLSVADVKRHGLTIPPATFARRGDPDALKQGDEVYALGHPGGRRWRVNVSPDRFVRRAIDWLYFESTVLAPGHSGGALLNERREIVGMLRGDQPPDGQALNISRLVEQLRDWGYPVSLGQKPVVDFTGTWQGTIDYGRNGLVYGKGFVYRAVFKFDVESDKVAGIATVFRVFRKIKDGRIKDDVINFTIADDNDSADYHYRGKISGDRIEFTVREEGRGSPVYWTTHRIVAARTVESAGPALLSVPRRECKKGQRELVRFDVFDEYTQKADTYVLCGSASTVAVLGDFEVEYAAGHLEDVVRDLRLIGARCGEKRYYHRPEEGVLSETQDSSSVVIFCQEMGVLAGVGLRVVTRKADGTREEKKLVVKWPQ